MQTRVRSSIHDDHVEEEQQLAGIGAIVKGIGAEIGALLNNTFRLFACESQERFSKTIALLMRLGLAIGLALIGIGFALAGINSLLVAALADDALARQTAEWVVPLGLGLVTAIVGYVLYRAATRRLDRIDIAPRKTVDSLRSNAEWARHWTKGEPS